MSRSQPGESARIRREPPRFRSVAVQRVERLGPRLVRVTLGGAELEGLTVDEPAASVRLLLPDAPGATLVMPVWNGNEFLRADGSRPTIRTFTPRRLDPDAPELDIDAVLHGVGPASQWAGGVTPGAAAALSGPGRGYTIDTETPAFLLAGDESAIPAISQLLEALPHSSAVHVRIEVADADGRVPLPAHPRVTVEWSDLPSGAPPGDALVAAVRAVDLPPGVRVWAAGEAAAMQRIRRYLFDERNMQRSQTTVRGYWKRGRAGADDG